MKIFLIAAAAFLLVCAIAESYIILVTRREKLGDRGITVAHLSDLHKRRFGKNNSRLIERTKRENPDLIVISGDIVSRSCTDFSDAEYLLRKLRELAPVYMVWGNHENDLSPELLAEFTEAVHRSGAKLMNNRSKSVEINGRRLNICGLTLPQTVYKKNDKYRNLDVPTAEDIDALLGEKPEGETLLITHNPLFAELYSGWGADFTLCGHVHGGIVVIPFTRIGILSPERKFFPKYSKGVYTIGRMKLLLSGGLGKRRLFNPAEIVIYKL